MASVGGQIVGQVKSKNTVGLLNTKFQAKTSGLILCLAVLVSPVAHASRYLVVLKNKDNVVKAEKMQVLKAAGAFSFSQKQNQLQSNSIYRLNLNKMEALPNINSLIVEISSAEELEKLKLSQEVVMVDEEVFHPAPRPISGTGFVSFSKALNNKKINLFDGNTVLNLTTPWGIIAVKAPEAWSLSQGGKGRGARVVVLDTGIDKNHPSLAANFEEGKDFVGDTNPGPYAFYDLVGHGSHVSGTIAGVQDKRGFAGVAPEAKILTGRVCGSIGCSNIAVAKGINWAIEKKADVISMSLGGSFSTPSERQAIYNADQAGITVVAAAGNDGTASVGYPAALPTVIAVGAVDSNSVKASFSQYGPELAIVAPGVDVTSSVPQGTGRQSVITVTSDEGTEEVQSSGFIGSKDLVAPESNTVVAAGLGRAEDFANVDVRGRFALVQRGGKIPFIDKVKNAMAAGAVGVVIYNNEAGLIHGSLGTEKFSIGVVGLDKVTGEKIVGLLQRGISVKLTLLSKVTDYVAMDGTSMATPHVSGVVALMKAANKALTPTQVKAILKKSATPLSPNSNNEYGAGLVNAEEAVKLAIDASTSYLLK